MCSSSGSIMYIFFGVLLFSLNKCIYIKTLRVPPPAFCKQLSTSLNSEYNKMSLASYLFLLKIMLQGTALYLCRYGCHYHRPNLQNVSVRGYAFAISGENARLLPQVVVWFVCPPAIHESACFLRVTPAQCVIQRMGFDNIRSEVKWYSFFFFFKCSFSFHLLRMGLNIFFIHSRAMCVL